MSATEPLIMPTHVIFILAGSVCFLFSSSFHVDFMVNTHFMHDLNLVLETKSFVPLVAFSYDTNYYSN